MTAASCRIRSTLCILTFRSVASRVASASDKAESNSGLEKGDSFQEAPVRNACDRTIVPNGRWPHELAPKGTLFQISWYLGSGTTSTDKLIPASLTWSRI